MKFSQNGARILNNDCVVFGVYMPLKKVFAFGKSFLSRSALCLAFDSDSDSCLCPDHETDIVE